MLVVTVVSASMGVHDPLQTSIESRISGAGRVSGTVIKEGCNIYGNGSSASVVLDDLVTWPGRSQVSELSSIPVNFPAMN